MQLKQQTWYLGFVSVISTMLIFVAVALVTTGAEVTAQPDSTKGYWDIETLLSVDAVAPYFDYLPLGDENEGQESFLFSFIDRDTGDLRVARMDGGVVQIQTVADSQVPGLPVGLGNDLAGTGISFSQPNADGSSAAALASWSGSWSSEIVDPNNGGGSTLIANGSFPGFPHDSILFYSGPNGLFAAQKVADEEGWSSKMVDADAKAETSISLAFDRMGFPSLAYCTHTEAGDALEVVWLGDFDEQWQPVTLDNQTCTDVQHFGPWFGDDVGQFIYSTDDHLNFLWGDTSSRSIDIIDSAQNGGWIGRGLSAETNIVDYWMSYIAHDPASKESALRIAFSSENGWQTMEGPSGDFAAWTYLEEFWMGDNKPTRIRVLYYDGVQGALKRAIWPPEPDFFLPVINKP